MPPPTAKKRRADDSSPARYTTVRSNAEAAVSSYNKKRRTDNASSARHDTVRTEGEVYSATSDSDTSANDASLLAGVDVPIIPLVHFVSEEQLMDNDVPGLHHEDYAEHYSDRVSDWYTELSTFTHRETVKMLSDLKKKLHKALKAAHRRRDRVTKRLAQKEEMIDMLKAEVDALEGLHNLNDDYAVSD